MPASEKVLLHFDSSVYGDSEDAFLQDEESIPIAELIPQILIERQSFLNITEDSLREEIAQKGVEVVNDDVENTEEDAESAFQTFQRRKFELLGHINSALNETSLSLDFVSLLMSAVKPNITKTTMSPHLSKNVPMGSLNSDRLSVDSEAHEEKKPKKAENIGLGWKYQSLNHITGLFKGAGTQLREQVEVEHQYWRMINKVLSHDEILFKVRDPLSGSRAIGVKYGYGDSGSSYHDKGLAVLRRDDETGDISFSPIMSGNNKISHKSNEFTRVKILSKIDDDYMLTGQSVFEKDSIKDKSDTKVINDIEKARFFLFEEDLFYHLIREAKNLINYNVSIISNKIIIEIYDQIIEVESVVYDENNEEDLDNVYQNINKESSKNNEKAQAILTFLKLMLCCYYNYNLELKQKIPTSFTKWKQTNSHPLMLRPLIGHIRHEINVRNVHTIISNICKGLDPKQLTYEIEEEKNVNLKLSKSTNPFRKAIERPVSTFKLILKKLDTGEHLLVDVEVTSTDIFVNLVINLTIAKYKSMEDLKQNQQGTNVLQLKFTDLFEIEESLNWTILNIVQN